MANATKHVGKPIQIKKKGGQFTQCTLVIYNNSQCDADTGDFIFRSSLTGNHIRVDTPPVFAGSPGKTVPFDWPYDEKWDQYAGVINAESCPIYWEWRDDSAPGGWIPTDEFPDKSVEMDSPLTQEEKN
jgi:hypothetical protein